jgi:hypothetical protein
MGYGTVKVMGYGTVKVMGYGTVKAAYILNVPWQN